MSAHSHPVSNNLGRSLALTAALAAALTAAAPAQNGDRKGHDRMDQVVPAEKVPAAPVLAPAEALKSFKLAAGFVIEPVASEPNVEKPVALDFDARGRMWVCEMLGYMPDIDGNGEDSPIGRIAILEDSDGDGSVDKRTVFLDKLLLPRAIALVPGGILFADQAKLFFVARNGDSPAGQPVVVDPTYATGGNVEHKANGLIHGLDNWIYNSKSDRRYRQIAGKWVVESTAFRGQWGIAMDDYGRLYHNNNSTILFGDFVAPNLLLGNPGINLKTKEAVQIGSNRVFPSRVTPGVNRAYIAKANGYNEDTLDPASFKLTNTTAAAGLAIYRGNNFPAEWYGNAFVCESVVNLLKAVRFQDDNGKFKGSHPLAEDEFLTSTDERFRPVNVYTAPDGSLYLLDMYHGIIQHKTYMTTYLREQVLSRGLDAPGLGHGRIYRIRFKDGPLAPKVNLETLPAAELVSLLAHPNGWHRDMARRVLIERNDPATVPLLEKLAAAMDSPLGQLGALWTLEGMNRLGATAVLAALEARDPKVVASALWASTRITQPAEQAKLESALVALKPANAEVSIYLARALGPLGTPAAFNALAALLARDGKKSFVREAAISGLDQHELAFKAAHAATLNDPAMVKWLDEGAAKATATVDAASALSGEHLASFKRGKELYVGSAACFGCHGADGSGMPNLGPPLNGSEWVTGKPETLLAILLHGMSGPITVAGERYTPAADMPGLYQNPSITDANLADIATYVRAEWSNRSSAVTPAQVAAQRKATAERAGRPYTAKDFGAE
jgi:glucose/arabinose dehydrogenase/mono/diheme cytochrome c family protein